MEERSCHDIIQKGEKEDLLNYRSISVCAILSKIYRRHILKHFSFYLKSHNFLSSFQIEFEQNYSYTTAVHHLIPKRLDAKKLRVLQLSIS